MQPIDQDKPSKAEHARLGTSAVLAGIGSRSGLPFETLKTMARSKRMERGQHSRDPFYYHAHDCQGCEQECNGIRGTHIAEDASDIQFS